MKKIVLLSYGYLTADPRIITIADSLKASGFEVIGINLHPLILKNTAHYVLFKKHICHNVVIKSWLGAKVLLTKCLARLLSGLGLGQKGEYWYFKSIDAYTKKAVQHSDFQALIKGADVFYGCEMFFGAFIAYHAAHHLNKAFIFDIKELYSDMTYQLPEQLKRFILNKEKLFIEQSMMFPCVAQGIGEYYSNLHAAFKEKSYILLPNTPSKLPEAPVAGVMKKNKHIRFVMIAGFSPRIRGIELLIQIWAKLMPETATLDLYLSHLSTIDKKHLLSLAGESAERSLWIKAPVQEDNIIQILVDYDVGIIPYLPDVCLNHRYCCPGKFGQYLKAGLAVLSSDTENITPLIKDFNLGSVYPTGDFLLSVKVFQDMISHPEQIKLMQDNAKHFFEHQYHWGIFAEAFSVEIKRKLNALGAYN